MKTKLIDRYMSNACQSIGFIFTLFTKNIPCQLARISEYIKMICSFSPISTHFSYIWTPGLPANETHFTARVCFHLTLLVLHSSLGLSTYKTDIIICSFSRNLAEYSTRGLCQAPVLRGMSVLTSSPAIIVCVWAPHIHQEIHGATDKQRWGNR